MIWLDLSKNATSFLTMPALVFSVPKSAVLLPLGRRPLMVRRMRITTLQQIGVK